MLIQNNNDLTAMALELLKEHIRAGLPINEEVTKNALNAARVIINASMPEAKAALNITEDEVNKTPFRKSEYENPR